jgi:hypothetical protein
MRTSFTLPLLLFCLVGCGDASQPTAGSGVRMQPALPPPLPPGAPPPASAANPNHREPTTESPDLAAGPISQETPEAAFASYRQAVRARDWRQVFRLYSPESRENLVSLTLSNARFQNVDVTDVLERHGYRSGLADVSDAEAFYADLCETQFPVGGPPNSRLQLRQVDPQGDYAIGILEGSLNGLQVEMTQGFARVNGRWYLHERVIPRGAR